MDRYLQLFEAENKPDSLSLAKLPYDVHELEPVLSEANVKYHYHTLSKAYVDRYNNGEGDSDFNYGGAMLHNLWWAQLRAPGGANKPHGDIAALIDSRFGSYEEFRSKFAETAMTLQGSGWCYLSKSGDIKTLKNQDYVKSVLLPIDLWEHSWTYDFAKPSKPQYLKNIWRIINWDVINHRLSA